MKEQNKKRKRLTPRQARFVELYLGCLNAEKAAKEAGFSDISARTKSYLWVGKSKQSCPPAYLHVWEAVQAGLAEKSQEAGISTERFLDELRRLAFLDPAQAFVKGTMVVRNIHDIPEDIRRCIQSVSPWKDGEYKITFCDKTKALDMIGKYLGAFTVKTELSGPGGGPIKTEGTGVDLSKLSTDDLIQLRQILEKSKSESDPSDPGPDDL